MKNEFLGLLEESRHCISVMAVTGIRSEYDLMYPLLNEMHNSDNFDVSVVVTGAHLTPLHNYSVKEIEQDGFTICSRIETTIEQDDTTNRVLSCALLMKGLGEAVEEHSPDLLLVLGDREEPLVAAMVGNYMNVPIVHLAGGDSTNPEGGNVDEQSRHATTKLSHLHLTMTSSHSERILKLGEEPWRVHTVGSGGVDRLRLTPHLSRDALRKATALHTESPYAVFIHHPLNGDFAIAKLEISAGVKKATEAGLQVIMGVPNSDPGSVEIVKFINGLEGVQVYKNLSRDAFINLLRHADLLMGNSSLAFHEADYLGLPAINIGERQRGREHSGNVIFCESNEDAVGKAAQTALYDETFRDQLNPNQSLYGDGLMASRVLKILMELPIKKQVFAKQITF